MDIFSFDWLFFSAGALKCCTTVLAMSRGVVLRLSYQKSLNGRKIRGIFRVGKQELWLIAGVAHSIFIFGQISRKFFRFGRVKTFAFLYCQSITQLYQLQLL